MFDPNSSGQFSKTWVKRWVTKEGRRASDYVPSILRATKDLLLALAAVLMVLGDCNHLEKILSLL